MLGKNRFLTLLAAVLMVIAAFYAGTRYQKNREALKNYVRGIALLDRFRGGAATTALPVEVTSAGANPAPIAPYARHSTRALDTALLPLSVDTVSMPPELGVHNGPGGGFTVIGDAVVIVDRKGLLFSVEAKGDKIRRLALPELPNHLDEWERFGPKPVVKFPFATSNAHFVVHDVEARKEPNGIRLYVSFERYLRQLNTTALAVSAIRLSNDDLSPLGPWEDIYQSQPLMAPAYFGLGAGGRMVFAEDSLYLTVGDYQQDNVFMDSKLEAQNPDSDFGKILKIDLRTKTKSIVSMGHRNPQGLTMTSAGRIFATEHGPRGGDLLTEIKPGTNFGWPIETFGTHYTTYDWPNRGRGTAGQVFDKPLFAWVPSIGISNLIEAKNFDPRWEGDFLVGSLKSQTLFRLHRDGDGRVVYSEPVALGQRLRDIGALPDGTLVLWTDEAQLLYLTVDQAKLATNRR